MDYILESRRPPGRLKGEPGGAAVAPETKSQSEGVSPERDIWSLCVFACRWLWGMALVGSSPPPSASFCAGTTWETQKSTNIDKTHKIHAPKFQGVFFSEGAEPPEAITTSRTARGT